MTAELRALIAALPCTLGKNGNLPVDSRRAFDTVFVT
jgi:hypothetical protein